MADSGAAMADSMPNKDDPRYQRVARLLAQKLGVDWRSLPAEQVVEYMRKIEIARQKPPQTDNEGL